MQPYELLYILPGTLPETEVPKHVETVKTLLTDLGAENVTVSEQGKNRLAYPMKHIRYGYFQLGFFNADPVAVPDIEAKLRLTDNMLRVLVRRIPDHGKPMTTIAFSGMSHAANRERDEDGSEGREFAPLTPAKKEEGTTEVIEEKKSDVRETKEPMTTTAENVDLEDINKKLDQLLEGDMADV